METIKCVEGKEHEWRKPSMSVREEDEGVFVTSTMCLECGTYREMLWFGKEMREDHRPADRYSLRVVAELKETGRLVW